MYTAKLPKIFFCGPSPSALEFLYGLVSETPSVFLSDHKNYSFLINKNKYNSELPLYAKQYAGKTEAQVSAEFSDHYLSFSQAWARRLETLHAFHIHDLRFVIVLKNPFLVFADKFLEARKTNENLFVETILERENEAFVKNELREFRLDNLFLYPGKVSGHISYLFSRFKRNQFLFITERELMGSPQVFMNKLSKFIGIEKRLLTDKQIQLFGQINRHEVDGYWKSCNEASVSFYDSLRSEIKASLHDYYEDDIRDISRLLDLNLNAWKDPNFVSKPSSLLSGFGFLSF